MLLWPELHGRGLLEALRVSSSMTGRAGLEPSDKMLSSPLSQSLRSLSLAALSVYEKKMSTFDTQTIFSKQFFLAVLFYKWSV